jgi:hypothetical protein
MYVAGRTEPSRTRRTPGVSARRQAFGAQAQAGADFVGGPRRCQSAKEALKRAGRKPEDVDLIIVGTTSPDYMTPDTSVFYNTNWARRMPVISTSVAPARRSPLRSKDDDFAGRRKVFNVALNEHLCFLLVG